MRGRLTTFAAASAFCFFTAMLFTAARPVDIATNDVTGRCVTDFLIQSKRDSSTHGHTGKYSLSGRIDNLDGNVRLLSADGLLIAETLAKDGCFDFVFRDTLPFYAGLWSGDILVDQIFIDGGITVSGDLHFPKAIISSGTPANDNFKWELKEQSRSSDMGIGAVETCRDTLFAEQLIKTAVANTSNILGAYLVDRYISHILTSDGLRSFIGYFDENMCRHPYLARHIRRLEYEKRFGPMPAYIPINMEDISGRMVCTDSLLAAGKYILIDFWATWCEPCMSQMPVMKYAHGKYSSRGFEICAVSLNKDRTALENFIEDYRPGWVNVCSFSGSGCQAAQDYDIGAVPSNFLVSPDGYIIATDLHGEVLLEILSEIFD